MLAQASSHHFAADIREDEETGLAGRSAWRERQGFWSGTHKPYDVVIIGGGVLGACLHHRLTLEGRRVLLTDRGDFAGGTSQSSAMLVWGGLLYLKNLDIASVVSLCAARDRMIRERSEQVHTRRLDFLFGARPHRSPWIVRTSLALYWLLGLGRRARPTSMRRCPDHAFVRPDSARLCLSFEEAQLRHSDAQFVLERALTGRGQGAGVPMNYCEVGGGSCDPHSRLWTIELRDTLCGHNARVQARWVVNAAGAWADRVNSAFAVEAPWKHVLAKGVSLTIARPPGHDSVLVFDDKDEREGLSLVPWGPVSLWGSTERMAQSPEEAREPDASDVGFLVESLNRHLSTPIGAEDVIALRIGIRTIVVHRDHDGGSPLRLSKRWKVWQDPERPWITLYGGKLTSSESIAARAAKMLRKALGKQPAPYDGNGGIARQDRNPACPSPPGTEFAGLPVPSASWCADHQRCWTLEDYLRRRTNIAQWIPRGGLGATGEHSGQLAAIAQTFARPGLAAADILREYASCIADTHDQVLGHLVPTGVQA